MPKTKPEFTLDFWHYYFKRYTDFKDVDDKRVLTKVKNVFNGRKKDLTINFETEIARFGKEEHPLREYLEHYHENLTPEKVDEQLQYALQEFRDRIRRGQEQEFVFDENTLCWSRQDGNTRRVVTNFNLVFESIIRIFNMEENVWERHYECYLEFMKDGKKHTSTTFRLSPDDCLRTMNFQQATWRINFVRSFFKNDAELQHFFVFLNDHYRPRIVSQYDHFGFITYERRKYYLARNVLVEIPEKKKEALRLIAPDDQNCFHVQGEHYIQLDPRLEPAPHFDLGPVDPDTGQYQEDEKLLLDKRNFQYYLNQVGDHLEEMVAGQTDDQGTGDMLLAYLFSYLFFEDIYKTFTHIIFLYIYGRANTGKGKLAEIMLTFFGIPFIDSLTHPTAAALENNLASHSQIPCWIDEFVPELAGKKSKIQDQLFNTWFELRIRQISSAANRQRNAFKITRCMLMFCSNYLPETDHLNSRLLKLEYSTVKRGDESHFYWLASNKKLLQQLFLSSLQWYNRFDRQFYSNELVRYKRRIKEQVVEQLNDKKERLGTSFNIEDRQVEQMAALCATYEFITGGDLNTPALLQKAFEQLNKSDNEQEQKDLEEMIRMDTSSPMFKYAVKFLVDNAQEVGLTDPLSEFLNTVGYLVDDQTINEKHYNWTRDGDLKLYWGGVWAAYEKFKGNIVTNKELIRRMIASMSDNPHGKTLNWTPRHMNQAVRKWGYLVKSAKDDKRFAYAFNYRDPDELPGAEQATF